MSNDYEDWARRHSSRGPEAKGAATPAKRPAAAAAPSSPPAPPAGYTWAWNAQMGALVLIPLATPPVAYVQAPQPAWGPPPRQQGNVVPWGAPSAPVATAQGTVIPFPVVSTCELVRPGNRDTYAELLATLPDLVPQDPNLQPGQMSASTMAEIAQARGVIEQESGRALLSHDDSPAFPVRGRGVVGTSGAAPLKPGLPAPLAEPASG